VPPPPGDLLEASFDEWLRWVSAKSSMPEVVRAALAHYQFETLHPFSDGNGRLGRLVVVLQLMQYSVLHYPILIVSPWFEARRREYQDQLLHASQTGDFDQWVAFFAAGLRAQASETLQRVESLVDYQEELRAMIRERQIRGVRAGIMDDLVGQPIIAATWAARQYGVSYQAANDAIARLVRDGVLEEMTGRKYGRLFTSRRVLATIEV
jgi:Fic family protein